MQVSVSQSVAYFAFFKHCLRGKEVFFILMKSFLCVVCAFCVLRNFCLTQHHKDFLEISQFMALYLGTRSVQVTFCIWCEIRVSAFFGILMSSCSCTVCCRLSGFFPLKGVHCSQRYCNTRSMHSVDGTSSYSIALLPKSILYIVL